MGEQQDAVTIDALERGLTRHDPRVAPAHKRFRRARLGIAAGLSAVAIAGAVYMSGPDKPPKPQEYRQLTEARESVGFLERHYMIGSTTGNERIDSLTWAFVTSDGYTELVAGVNEEIRRLEELPVVLEYENAKEAYDDKFKTRGSWAIGAGLLGLLLGATVYLKEEKRYYNRVSNAIGEQFQGLSEKMTRLEKNIDELITRVEKQE